VAVQFSGPVDLTTVAGGIFLAAADRAKHIGLDQVEFDPATNTVYGKPASVLDQGRRYAVIDAGAATETISLKCPARPYTSHWCATPGEQIQACRITLKPWSTVIPQLTPSSKLGRNYHRRTRAHGGVLIVS